MIPDADPKTLLKPEEVAKVVLKLSLSDVKVKSESLVDICK